LDECTLECRVNESFDAGTFVRFITKMFSNTFLIIKLSSLTFYDLISPKAGIFRRFVEITQIPSLPVDKRKLSVLELL
jgi:hypothetical protein